MFCVWCAAQRGIRKKLPPHLSAAGHSLSVSLLTTYSFQSLFQINSIIGKEIYFVKEYFVGWVSSAVYHKLRQFCPFYIQVSIFPCSGVPFYERQSFSHDFNAGDATGVDTAPGVHITWELRVQRRAVGVSGNQCPVVFLCPCSQAVLGAVFCLIIFCRAGGIQYADLFQWFP